ncbi:uncharacterized protein LOC115408522 [Salarias fasciatus]|uniref:uncharacterized protein LOC115408522 n=1 Tax=Salarias fasciatus TaxID=181472 RepID=UPI001176C01F|nr:uncharacterized protein LOC115408522 [Salarias fasciatus]
MYYGERREQRRTQSLLFSFTSSRFIVTTTNLRNKHPSWRRTGRVPPQTTPLAHGATQQKIKEHKTVANGTQQQSKHNHNKRKHEQTPKEHINWPKTARTVPLPIRPSGPAQSMGTAAPPWPLHSPLPRGLNVLVPPEPRTINVQVAGQLTATGRVTQTLRRWSWPRVCANSLGSFNAGLSPPGRLQRPVRGAPVPMQHHRVPAVRHPDPVDHIGKPLQHHGWSEPVGGEFWGESFFPSGAVYPHPLSLGEGLPPTLGVIRTLLPEPCILLGLPGKSVRHTQALFQALEVVQLGTCSKLWFRWWPKG